MGITHSLTISPNPREYSSIDQLYKDWTEKFYKIQRHFDQLLVVAELSSQLHYHCIGVLKDPVGWTRHRYKLSLFHNFKVHKMFKNKLHYLFKDVVKTYNSLHKQVIFEKEDYISLHEREVANRNPSRTYLDVPQIPEWMLVGGYISD